MGFFLIFINPELNWGKANWNEILRRNVSNKQFLLAGGRLKRSQTSLPEDTSK